MKTANPLLSLFFSAFLILSSSIAANAQDKPASQQTQAELVLPWLGLVTVDGEDRTRTLRVSGSNQVEPGIFELDAIYGWTDGNQTAVKAELLIATDQKHTLRITTQPGSKIAATQGLDGIFVGTFTATNGKIKGVAIQILSESALAKTSEGPTINQPSGDVPASCARFAGGWAGDWGFGKRWLWVTEVNTQCIAKYSYSPQTKTFKSVEIKGDDLAFPCGASIGTCSFEHHGDELWGRYIGSDGDNTAVFRKIK